MIKQFTLDSSMVRRRFSAEPRFDRQWSQSDKIFFSPPLDGYTLRPSYYLNDKDWNHENDQNAMHSYFGSYFDHVLKHTLGAAW